MKLLALLPDLDGGGAQRTMINLINHLHGTRFDAALAVGRADGTAKQWLDPAVPLIDLGCARTRQAFGPFRRLVRERRPDIVFSTMVDANILAVAAAGRGPKRPAVIVRETNSHRAREDLGSARRRLVRWAYRRADRVVALSEGVRQELVADYGLTSDSAVTIHNPVAVAALAGSAEAARRKPPPWIAHGIDPVGPVLIAAGRLHRQKGFDRLLRAFAAVSDGEAHLMILGEGGEREALETLARKLDIAARTHLVGFVEDPAAWFAHGDLFVLSSRWEGFGHVLVEAMACGLPVVATDCPHGPADIITDTSQGVLIPVDDLDALIRAIDDLLTAPDRRQALSVAGRARAAAFEAGEIATRYGDLLTTATEDRMLNDR